ncbi:hypothetical protein [Pseudanabaena sp. PCC 6802]|uniref:hypothetical protein n=1 Tax=Pseudanabaena sp. PCC 6802 TaxID=118173 RepID=UPI00034C697D|nr:hypothetical protein [Pseudanabaena sp. PCC 6802]
MQISPQTAYDNLSLLDSVDVSQSAFYRQLAQEVLADPDISLSWRQAIADRLNRANHQLAHRPATDEDSY